MNKKILLVDDAKVFLEAEKYILEPTGAQILTAHSGAEALKLVETERPHIVLLDLMMPDVSGDKVCAHIKGNPATADIPVIMVTARGRTEEMERCRRAGCDDFLTKPIKHEVLLAKVQEYIQYIKVPHRHSIRILVRLETQGPKAKEVSFGTSGDISKSGMSVETDKAIEIGDTVKAHFFLAGSDEEMIVQAKVARRESRGANYIYGIQFANLSPLQHQAISRFIDAKK